METHFPFLCYCASHWKAKQIGTGNYLSWKSYYDRCKNQPRRDCSEKPEVTCKQKHMDDKLGSVSYFLSYICDALQSMQDIQFEISKTNNKSEIEER